MSARPASCTAPYRIMLPSWASPYVLGHRGSAALGDALMPDTCWMISLRAGSCARISLPGTAVALMIATDEELKIASDAWKLAP
jgi:hypothetical protein